MNSPGHTMDEKRHFDNMVRAEVRRVTMDREQMRLAIIRATDTRERKMFAMLERGDGFVPDEDETEGAQ